MNTSARLSPAPSRAFAAPPTPAPEESGAAWSGLFRVLRRRMRLILGVILVICLAALPAILDRPKVYYAETRVLASPAPALSLTAGMDGREVGFDMQAELARLLSGDVTAAVISGFDLASRPEFNAALVPPTLVDSAIDDLRAALASVDIASVDMAGVDPETAAVARTATGDTRIADKVAAAFGEALNVSLHGNVDVITVGFTARDPELAAAIPGALVDSYLAERQAHWRGQVTVAADWLDERIQAERQRVADMRAGIDRTLSEAGLEEGVSVEPVSGRLLRLAERQSILERERMDLAATRRSVAAALEEPGVAALSEPERLAALRTELGNELRALRQLEVTYGHGNDEVMRRKEVIAAVRADIASELTAHDRSLALRDAALEGEQDRLIDEIDATRGRLAALRSVVPQVDKQIEALRATEKVLSELEYRQQVLLAQAHVPPVSVDVLAPARVPQDPVGPGRKMVLLATAFGALLVGLTAAALVELRDNSTRSHEQLANLPMLAPVGLWPKLSWRRTRAMPREIAARAATPQAETLRDMLLLLESAHGGQLPRLLTVAAPRARDMPLPVAEWIALEIAATGRAVQLVQSGPARRQPVRLPGQGTGAGEEAIFLRRSLPRLVAEQGGDVSAALRALAAQCAAADIVTIVEAPPLLSPGALRFARFGGDMLLVLRWGRTPRPVVELVAGLLDKLGTPQVFSLIIDAKPHRHRLYGFTDRLSVG